MIGLHFVAVGGGPQVFAQPHGMHVARGRRPGDRLGARAGGGLAPNRLGDLGGRFLPGTFQMAEQPRHQLLVEAIGRAPPAQRGRCLDLGGRALVAFDRGGPAREEARMLGRLHDAERGQRLEHRLAAVGIVHAQQLRILERRACLAVARVGRQGAQQVEQAMEDPDIARCRPRPAIGRTCGLQREQAFDRSAGAPARALQVAEVGAQRRVRALAAVEADAAASAAHGRHRMRRHREAEGSGGQHREPGQVARGHRGDEGIGRAAQVHAGRGLPQAVHRLVVRDRDEAIGLEARVGQRLPLGLAEGVGNAVAVVAVGVEVAVAVHAAQQAEQRVVGCRGRHARCLRLRCRAGPAAACRARRRSRRCSCRRCGRRAAPQ